MAPAPSSESRGLWARRRPSERAPGHRTPPSSSARLRESSQGRTRPLVALLDARGGRWGAPSPLGVGAPRARPGARRSSDCGTGAPSSSCSSRGTTSSRGRSPRSGVRTRYRGVRPRRAKDRGSREATLLESFGLVEAPERLSEAADDRPARTPRDPPRASGPSCRIAQWEGLVLERVALLEMSAPQRADRPGAGRSDRGPARAALARAKDSRRRRRVASLALEPTGAGVI